MTREEAVNDLNAIKEFFEQESGAYPASLEYAIGVLKNELSADRPQGEWIGVEEDWRHQIEFWRCSECDFAVSSRYNFCPSCGARMKGADDDLL